MPTISSLREQALAKAGELDALRLAANPAAADLLDDLSACGGADGGTFADALGRKIEAASAAAETDPDLIDAAAERTAPRNYLRLSAEQAGDDAASDWLDEIAAVEALYSGNLRWAA